MPGGFSFSGNFGYVSDPLKLNFSGVIQSDAFRRATLTAGKFKSQSNPGHELTNGKEWVRYFMDHSFDDQQWNMEKAITTVNDIPVIFEEYF